MFIPISVGFATVFAIKEERTVLVDAGVQGQKNLLLGKLLEHAIAPADISLIVITHCHTDHFGCAAALRAATGAPVAVHAEDAPWLEKGSNPPITISDTVSRFVKNFMDEKAAKPVPSCKPDILLSDGFDLSPYGITGRIAHTPGHTRGSISALLPESEAIIADLLMGKMVNPHQPRWPFFVDNMDLVRQSLQKILDAGVEKFYCSHGGPFTRRNVEKLLNT